ncbi:SMI1/KNR4 family protein [Clostridium sp. SHJSY1]|uniref:SMI1/KNR4 family protein n=1 Tax=Clostridium sp. SHJSY1 TaxID=2942483 RepID=UPI0028758B04|nr:SMI1/KNR4 family protein [Clostridium sp. SHJSY1]MDS0526595.1 SMI1/KNR4 family protein [Clostridium sp. SHJSY1]
MNDTFILRENENKFYPVSEDEIKEVEDSIKLEIPKELKKFYKEFGYGFISGTEGNINRIMDPYSIRDFRLRKNDFEYYPDIEIYDEFEEGKIIFFEGNETTLLSIEISNDDTSNVYYYDTKIASSLKEFLINLQKDDNYYIDLLD